MGEEPFALVMLCATSPLRLFAFSPPLRLASSPPHAMRRRRICQVSAKDQICTHVISRAMSRGMTSCRVPSAGNRSRVGLGVLVESADGGIFRPRISSLNFKRIHPLVHTSFYQLQSQSYSYQHRWSFQGSRKPRPPSCRMIIAPRRPMLRALAVSLLTTPLLNSCTVHSQRHDGRPDWPML